MKNRLVKSILTLVSVVVLVSAFSTAMAADKDHKLVIQVSSDDARTQKIALNNAVNLQKLYGMDNVTIEVVAYGPGLGLLTTKRKQVV